MQKGSECTVDFTPVKWEDIGGLEKVKVQLQQVLSSQKFILTLELGGTFVWQSIIYLVYLAYFRYKRENFSKTQKYMLIIGYRLNMAKYARPRS